MHNGSSLGEKSSCFAFVFGMYHESTLCELGGKIMCEVAKIVSNRNFNARKMTQSLRLNGLVVNSLKNRYCFAFANYVSVHLRSHAPLPKTRRNAGRSTYRHHWPWSYLAQRQQLARVSGITFSRPQRRSRLRDPLLWQNCRWHLRL